MDKSKLKRSVPLTDAQRRAREESGHSRRVRQRAFGRKIEDAIELALGLTAQDPEEDDGFYVTVDTHENSDGTMAVWEISVDGLAASRLLEKLGVQVVNDKELA